MRYSQFAVLAPLACAIRYVLKAAEASSVGPGDDVRRWDIYHPIDEGLWGDTLSTKSSASSKKNNSSNDNYYDELQEEDVIVDEKFTGLRNDLRMAEIDSLRLFSKTHDAMQMQPMTYGIFNTGQSALRSMHKRDQHLIQPETLFGISSSLSSASSSSSLKKGTKSRQPTGSNDNDNVDQKKDHNNHLSAHHYRVCAALLFLRGYSDAAHEILLGVTLDNLEEAEYAATHRGQTDWAQTHYLSDAADMLHAAIHRMVEGKDIGEGDQTGYDNARYWLAGGPKLLTTPAHHPVRETLARIARDHAPKCCQAGVIVASAGSSKGAEHKVLSGGGKHRVVCVPCGQWDDFAFLQLCQRWAEGSLDHDKDFEDEVATLQRAEIILLLRHELVECLRQRAV